MAGFPISLMGAAGKLRMRCSPARRGLSTGTNAQEDRWFYWKAFALSGAVTVATIESLVAYANKESAMRKLLGNMLLEAKSTLLLSNKGQSSSSLEGEKES